MNATLKPKATILDLDELMDKKMDEVPTLPDYINPPPGLYVLRVKDCGTEKYDIKDENKKPTGDKGTRIKITYEIVNTVSVLEGEQPVPNGSIFTESFQGTEEGIQYFKKAAMNILSDTDFEGASIRDVMDGVKGTEYEAKITVRKSAGKAAGQVYENLVIRAANPVVPTA